MLKAGFPNYEVFWQRFIVPLRANEEAVAIRSSLRPQVEYMAMAHYSVLYHFGMAITAILGSSPSLEPAVYHLSASTEMVDRLVYELSAVRTSAAESGPPLTELTDQEIAGKAREFARSKYKQAFKDFGATRRPVQLPLHTIQDEAAAFAKSHIGGGGASYAKWKKQATKVRHYRNAIVHNPKLGTLEDPKNGSIWVPREDKLREYTLWSKIHKRKNNADFELLSELLTHFHHELLDATNELWQALIGVMDWVSTTDYWEEVASAEANAGGTQFGAPIDQRGTGSSASTNMISSTPSSPGSAVATLGEPSSETPPEPGPGRKP